MHLKNQNNFVAKFYKKCFYTPVNKIRLYEVMVSLNKIFICWIIMALIFPSSAQSLQKHKDFPTLTVVDHPLVQHKLTLIRNKKTDTRLFGQLLSEIAMLIGYEVTRNLNLKDIEIETPITSMMGKEIDEQNIVIVPILRAGLGMARGLHQLMPAARQGHIGVYRDEKTKKPVEYYFKMPANQNQVYIVVDPMLATGNSSSYAVSRLIASGVSVDKIIFMALVVAPEGMKLFQKDHPTIPVFAAALDEKLDKNSYITPGLGDAGDRLFGTK